MATKKSKTRTQASTRPIPLVVRKLAVYLWGPGRPWLLACLMVAALAGAAVVLGLRLASIRYQLSLPTYRSH